MPDKSKAPTSYHATPYCFDPNCVYCRELRLVNKLVKSGNCLTSADDMRNRAIEMRETAAPMKQSLVDRRAARDEAATRQKKAIPVSETSNPADISEQRDR